MTIKVMMKEAFDEGREGTCDWDDSDSKIVSMITNLADAKTTKYQQRLSDGKSGLKFKNIDAVDAYVTDTLKQIFSRNNFKLGILLGWAVNGFKWEIVQ